MFRMQLLEALSELASAGFNARVYLLSTALGHAATDNRGRKQPVRKARP